MYAIVILPKIYSYRVPSSSQTWSSKFFLIILLLDLSFFFFQHNSVLFELFIILPTHRPKERQSDNKLNRGITFYLIIARWSCSLRDRWCLFGCSWWLLALCARFIDRQQTPEEGVRNDRVLGVHHEIQTQQDRIMEQSGNLRALAGICMYVSKTRQLWSSNAAFKNAFFTVINYHYDHGKATNLETEKRTKRIEIRQSQITNHNLFKKKTSVS